MAKRSGWRAGAAMLCGSVLTAVMVSSAMASEYELPATSKTVAWGHYDFDGKPVLRVRSGDTVVVGAPGESSSSTGVNGNQSSNAAASSGAAYVFVRNGTNWSQLSATTLTNLVHDVFDFSRKVLILSAHHL